MHASFNRQQDGFGLYSLYCFISGIGGDTVRFNEKGDGLGTYDIYQYQMTENGYEYVLVRGMDRQVCGYTFYIHIYVYLVLYPFPLWTSVLIYFWPPQAGCYSSSFAEVQDYWL